MRGAQIPDSRSPCRLTFFRVALIFVDLLYGNWFVSPLWRQEFWSDSWIFENLCVLYCGAPNSAHRWATSLLTTRLKAILAYTYVESGWELDKLEHRYLQTICIIETIQVAEGRKCFPFEGCTLASPAVLDEGGCATSRSRQLASGEGSLLSTGWEADNVPQRKW